MEQSSAHQAGHLAGIGLVQNFIRNVKVDLAFDEAERVLLGTLLKYVIISTVAIVLVILPFTYPLVFSSPLRIALTLAVFAVNLVAWLLLRRGLLLPTSVLLTAGYWTIVLILVLATGGLESPWVLAQVAITVMAGLLLGGWGGVFIAALTLLADYIIYRASSSGNMPFSPLQAGLMDNWLAVSATFTVVSVVVLLAGNLAQTGLRRARQNERRFRSLFDNTNDLIFLVGLDRKIIAVNPPAAQMLGYETEELVGRPYVSLVPVEERESVERNFKALDEIGISPFFERTLVRKDMSRPKVEFHVALIKDVAGNPLYYQGVGRDMTERKHLEGQLRSSLDEMEALAMQDPLTGLLNRRAITEHAEAEWHRSQRDERPLCLVLIDLDNLKVVNDTQGHQMGDQVILALARVIKESKRRYDWAGRWGGDEFMLVLPGTNLTEAKEVAERMRVNYSQTRVIKGLSGEALISLGIACYSGRKGDETSLTKLIAQADRALYVAKEHGKNKVEVYLDEVTA